MHDTAAASLLLGQLHSQWQMAHAALDGKSRVQMSPMSHWPASIQWNLHLTHALPTTRSCPKCNSKQTQDNQMHTKFGLSHQGMFIWGSRRHAHADSMGQNAYVSITEALSMQAQHAVDRVLTAVTTAHAGWRQMKPILSALGKHKSHDPLWAT